MLDLKNCPFCGGDKVSVQHGTTSTRGQYLMVWCVSCQAAGGEHLAEAEAIAAWNRRALQAVGPEPAVAVKPLEWAFRDTKISDDLSVWGARAEGLDFTYSIWGSTNENATAAFTVPKLHNGFFDTLEAAKAAAETDYASRIRSALVATPPAEPVVEALTDDMIEAACIAHWQDWPNDRSQMRLEAARRDMRSALVAALAAKPAVKDDETVVETISGKQVDAALEKLEEIRNLKLTRSVMLQVLQAALAAKGGRS